ncbi:MAG: L-aspartate oxidase [Acidobacteria bacterium]|nr:L-aspartate oxidase [Acidobacteriota bacterium]
METDFLIVGSGIAALRAIVALGDAGEIVVLTKADPREGSTGYAQGGIAAAFGADDSIDLHVADTLAAGDGLCDEPAVRLLVSEGVRYVRELIDWGAAFDRDSGGRPALAREGAHSVRRVLHARDATGREIGRTLWRRAGITAAPRVLQHALAVEAIVEHGRCAGMRFMLPDGREGIARARATLLATGGAGQVYRETTNPSVASGDGVAIAYRAGARVGDLEFVQFHPTALNVPDTPRFLLSEALRGEGARIVNEAGDAFMQRVDPLGDLAPRDRVARAIARESERTGRPIYLTLQHLEPRFVHDRFPEIAAACRQAGLDLARDRIPIGPAAHYMMGGVWTDTSGRTTVRDLYAAGEVACTAVHGANRLASNSLLEGLVFGGRAGEAMRVGPTAPDAAWPAGAAAPPACPGEGAGAPWRPSLDVATIRDVMWRRVGLFRDREGIAAALSQFEPAWDSLRAHRASGGRLDAAGWQVANLLTVALLIARAALRREESRGGHYRTDFPARDDLHWKRHIFEDIENNQNG